MKRKIQMIICQTCQHQEDEGALFCSECGSPLQIMTTKIHVDGTSSVTFDEPTPKRNINLASGAMTLQILESGQLLLLEDKDELTMGRASDGQIIMPDIDLTPIERMNMGFLAFMLY